MNLSVLLRMLVSKTKSIIQIAKMAKEVNTKFDLIFRKQAVKYY